MIEPREGRMEVEEDSPQVIRIAVPGEEAEPRGLCTWQYVFDGNIYAVFSRIQDNGTEAQKQPAIFSGDGTHTAKEVLDKTIVALDERLKGEYQNKQSQVVTTDRNPKPKMGFLK